MPKTGGGTAQFDDTTISTNAAAASDIATGKLAYVNGSLITGTNSGSGGATFVTSKQVTTSTTSTTASTLETWSTGHSEVWTSDKVVYVKLRDHAGKRNGYFYGSDNFFINILPVNGSSTTSSAASARFIYRYNSDEYGTNYYTGSTGYGVYVDTIYSDGRFRLRQRYNSTSSLTVNGTYDVEVYLIDVGTLLPSL